MASRGLKIDLIASETFIHDVTRTPIGRFGRALASPFADMEPLSRPKPVLGEDGSVRIRNTPGLDDSAAASITASRQAERHQRLTYRSRLVATPTGRGRTARYVHRTGACRAEAGASKRADA